MGLESADTLSPFKPLLCGPNVTARREAMPMRGAACKSCPDRFFKVQRAGRAEWLRQYVLESGLELVPGIPLPCCLTTLGLHFLSHKLGCKVAPTPRVTCQRNEQMHACKDLPLCQAQKMINIVVISIRPRKLQKAEREHLPSRARTSNSCLPTLQWEFPGS